MLATRLVKVAMVASLALFALLVAFNNVVDYGTNYQFVRHTLGMDTTFPGNALMTRAVTSPVLLTIAYWSIILTEGVTGLLLALGAIRMLTNVNAPAARFETAKRFVAIGAGLGFMLWFTGFMVIGGEWFAMWQSQTWNGQEAAFRFYMTLLAVLIFVNQTDSELPNREGEVG